MGESLEERFLFIHDSKLREALANRYKELQSFPSEAAYSFSKIFLSMSIMDGIFNCLKKFYRSQIKDANAFEQRRGQKNTGEFFKDLGPFPLFVPGFRRESVDTDSLSGTEGGAKPRPEAQTMTPRTPRASVHSSDHEYGRCCTPIAIRPTRTVLRAS